jgi:hypothetical protein
VRGEARNEQGGVVTISELTTMKAYLETNFKKEID